MRVKSVPRHLPRKDVITGHLRTKNGIATTRVLAELLSEKNIGEERKYVPRVKTVNFANYHEMMHEMNLAVRQQNTTSVSVGREIWKPNSSNNDESKKNVNNNDVIDLSRKGIASVKSEDDNSAASTAIETNSNDDNNNNNNNNNNNGVRNTYLYQIMTDPSLLGQISPKNQQLEAKPIATPKRKQVTEQQFSCPYCKRKFNDENELRRHHDDTNNRVDANNNQQLTCCACGKMFAQRRYLRYHQRCHSERNKYACEHCTRKYSRLDNLTRHNIFHTNPAKYPCNYCERAFARKDLLKKHHKCHENRFKYHCDACKKYFKGPISLDNHIKSCHDAANGGVGGKVTGSDRNLRGKAQKCS